MEADYITALGPVNENLVVRTSSHFLRLCSRPSKFSATGVPARTGANGALAALQISAASKRRGAACSAERNACTTYRNLYAGSVGKTENRLMLLCGETIISPASILPLFPRSILLR